MSSRKHKFILYPTLAGALLITWIWQGLAGLSDAIRQQTVTRVENEFPDAAKPRAGLTVSDIDIYPTGTWTAVVDGRDTAFLVKGSHRTLLGVTLPPPFRRITINEIIPARENTPQ